MNTEEEDIDIDWFSERYPYDTEARNAEVEEQVLKYFAHHSDLTILDVGAGSGSNFLYFVHRFPQNQKWYFFEPKADLKKSTLRRLRDFAGYHKYEIEESEEEVKITAPKKTIEIELISDNISFLKDSRPVRYSDLIMTNGVLHEYFHSQFETLTEIVLKNKKPFLATLNYQGLVFQPEDPFDQVFIDEYDASFDVNFVAGTAVPTTLVSLFEEKGWKPFFGNSNWSVEEDDIKMHYYFLNYMETAIEDLNLDARILANFKKWLQRKKDLVITRKQRLIVRHMDLFFAP